MPHRAERKGPIEFRILGPLAVLAEGRTLSLGGPKQRATLAVLLLHANEVVSTDRLIDALWGDHAPPTAAKTVQVYVSRLRKELGEAVLLTRPPGYMLEVKPQQLDLDRFERLVEEARGSPPEAAAARLRKALSLWRGEPLSDLAYEQFAQTPIARLEELRLSGLEQRIAADLALGRHADLVGELEGLVAVYPYKERLRRQLMLALYRSGRQAEALDVYQQARSILTDELGLEPGEELKLLEKAILQHDPALDAPAPLTIREERARDPAQKTSRPLRRWRAIATVGTLALAGGIAALVVALTGGGTSLVAPGDAVAAIDTHRGRVVSYTQSGSSPSNVTTGEGAVWVLNADDQTISRIDPDTKRVVKTFATGQLPTDLAVGAGALWVGNGASTKEGIVGNAYTASVARIDPHTSHVTRTVNLPSGSIAESGAYRISGVSQLAVGAGGVWAIDPDLSVSRIDPLSGRLVGRVPIQATYAIAAGKEGVWVVVIDGSAVQRINTAVNRPGQKIAVLSSGLAAIAVGAGSVWATAPFDGTVWRIEPGPRPLTRTISVGFGVTNIAFGDGAVWTGNFVDGTVSRIDPRTNEVTATLPVAGTPQGVASGSGSAWATVAGSTEQGALPASACGQVESGGKKPDLLIASDLPLQGSGGTVARTMADAIRTTLRTRGFRAGRFTIGFQSCDDSTAQRGGFDAFKCVSNAKAYGRAGRLVAVIGPYNSFCAGFEIPIANRAPGGPLALVSPANTGTGLTRDAPGTSKGEPGIYYPTGVRNYIRLAAPDDLQAAAHAVLAKQLGLRSVYVLVDLDYGIVIPSAFRRAARKVGIRIAGYEDWNPKAESYTALADRVARSGARGVFLGGSFFFNGNRVIRALRERLGGRVTIMGTDTLLSVPDLLHAVGPAARGMYVSIAGVTLDKLDPAGRRLLRAFTRTRPGGTISGTYVPQAVEATRLVLQAIARSDGTRASVLRALQASRENDGILGRFRLDRNGDMTPSPVAIFRVTGGHGQPGLVSDFRGSVVYRVIRVSTNLGR